MRWKNKPIPKTGDTRRLVKFAWIPTSVKKSTLYSEDTYTVWLEKYYQEQIYVTYPIELFVPSEWIVTDNWI